MTAPIRLAIVGMGKIAHDQHVPSVEASDRFDLVATVSQSGEALRGLPQFNTIEELAEAEVGIDAVALCVPPQVRSEIASAAIARGWHVFLEKPPGASLGEIAVLTDQAAKSGVTLFGSWHSRFAAGVASARDWLAARAVHRVAIAWRENVRQWHPGQDWIFEPGGFGVFDPGINALSIITEILPNPLFVEHGEIDIPENRAAPIAARIALSTTLGAPVALDLDFLQTGRPIWEITAETDDGTVTLSDGGATLTLPDGPKPAPGKDLHGEYAGLYRRFSALVEAGRSEVDVAPLRLVADTFLRARINRVAAFEW